MAKIEKLTLKLDVIRTDGSQYKQFAPEFTPQDDLFVEVSLPAESFIKPSVLSEEGLTALYVKLWKISSAAMNLIV